MAQVLLTVSGTITPQIKENVANGLRPNPDYMEMARRFDADLLDYNAARAQIGWFGQLLTLLGGSNLMLAWVCFLLRKQYRVIFTDGEQVGIPLAVLLKLGGRHHVQHFMIVHILSVGKKMLFFDYLGVQSHIDRFLVYSSWQKHFIEERWRVPAQRVVLTPFMVDAAFFSPTKVTPTPRRMICSVGLEFRDYPTLIEAVRGLDVEVVIAAASPWSKRSDTTQHVALPPNVTVQKFTQFELRQLYADCLFMVMPLYDVDFQAGITAILEAMAMKKTVICSKSKGQTDVIIDNETGLYVLPEDSAALRNAIQFLLDNPQMAERMGAAAMQAVHRDLNLVSYTERLHEYIQHALLEEAV